jgi:hypothetical protein
MNILIFGGTGSRRILCKVRFGMPRLFRNSYADFNCEGLVSVKYPRDLVVRTFGCGRKHDWLDLF